MATNMNKCWCKLKGFVDMQEFESLHSSQTPHKGPSKSAVSAGDQALLSANEGIDDWIALIVSVQRLETGEAEV